MSIVTRNTLLLVIALGLLSAEAARAQYGVPSIPGRKSKSAAANSRVPANLKIPFQGTGTIEAVAPGGMQVTAAGAVWLVKFDKNCKIEVTGSADPSFLRSGLLVRFTADVDKKGKATALLNELEIVSPQNAMVFARRELPPRPRVLPHPAKMPRCLKSPAWWREFLPSRITN